MGKSVVELLHGNLAVAVLVESSQESVLLLLGEEDIKGLEAGREFVDINETIIILVESLHQVNGVFLQAWELNRGLLNLLDDVFNRSSWEHSSVVFHVLFSVLVGLQKSELEAHKEHYVADQEVLFSVVLAIHWVRLLLSLHETAANSAGVLVANLVDLDCVVSAVEADDEASGFVVGLGADEGSLESQRVHILFEHLLHVCLRGLAVEVED